MYWQYSSDVQKMPPKNIFLMVLAFLQGKPKKNESLWGVACGVFRMLRKNYGCVRVDFTQPFSLKVAAVCQLDINLTKLRADLFANIWILCCRSTWTPNGPGISKPPWPWSRSFFPPSSLHSTTITLPATDTFIVTRLLVCVWFMGLFLCFCADLIILFLMEKMGIIWISETCQMSRGGGRLSLT